MTKTFADFNSSAITLTWVISPISAASFYYFKNYLYKNPGLNQKACVRSSEDIVEITEPAKLSRSRMVTEAEKATATELWPVE